MILLSGHSLTPARKVPLEAMSLQLKERESTATITPADMTGIGVNSWFKDDTDPGKDIVWRVRSIGTAYATNTPTVQLEHAISILKDIVLFGEITPAVITGNKNSKTCTAEQAVRFILSKCGDWTLGGISYNVSNPYKFDGDSLFDALETISDSLSDLRLQHLSLPALHQTGGHFRRQRDARRQEPPDDHPHGGPQRNVHAILPDRRKRSAHQRRVCQQKRRHLRNDLPRRDGERHRHGSGAEALGE